MSDLQQTFIQHSLKNLDRVRFAFITRVLKYSFFQNIYTKTSLRLFVGFVLLSILNFSLAVTRPDYLLIFGPLVYGYFHLFSSYFYIIPEDRVRSDFKVFLAVTFLVVILRIIYLKTDLAMVFVNGFVELLSALVLFLVIKTFHKRELGLGYLIGIGVLLVAWDYPLEFVSGTLFVHNWVAFIYWFIFAKNRTNKLVSLFASSLFFVIHLAICLGWLDSIIAFDYTDLFIIANSDSMSWVLAPWSDSEMIGKRALVLYSFGLAMHYFVWIKAIPENRQDKETPNSFKYSVVKFKEKLGEKTLNRFLIFFFSATSFWIIFPESGAYIYFLIAGFHAWTELVLLLPWIRK